MENLACINYEGLQTAHILAYYSTIETCTGFTKSNGQDFVTNPTNENIAQTKSYE